MSDDGEDKPTDRCPCGSQKFVVEKMTLTIRNVPLVFDGSLGAPVFSDSKYCYDDTKGDSDGWDRVADDDIRCAVCPRKFSMDVRTEMLVEKEAEKR